MASNGDRCSTDNQPSIALLRRLRAGEHVHFVHRVDVCDAVPEVLVADLEPVPGTGLDDDGYSRKWYFYHAKKYKNTRGDNSGHRHRAVTGGGGASWHQETRRDVEGSGGGTFTTLSYGLKTHPSARSIDRLGWCMVEYDFVAGDEAAAAAAASNYVLCKVYRSLRAKGKSASASAAASSSSKNKKASAKQTAKKRKAGGGDHPEAPPAKSISVSIQQQQEPPQVQQDSAAWFPHQPQAVESSEHVGNFNFSIEDFNFYVDENMLRDEAAELGQVQVQQPIAEPEHDGQLIQQLPCGPALSAQACTVGDMLGAESSSEHEHGDMEEFTVQWLLRGQQPQQQQQPTIVQPEHDGRFIELPCGPVLATEIPAGDTMMSTYGHCSSYAPSWLYTSAAGCSFGLLPLQGSSLPYLMY